jgi:Ring finger domain/CUE domain
MAAAAVPSTTDGLLRRRNVANPSRRIESAQDDDSQDDVGRNRNSNNNSNPMRMIVPAARRSNNNPAVSNNSNSSSNWRACRWYFYISAVGAALAVMTAPSASSALAAASTTATAIGKNSMLGGEARSAGLMLLQHEQHQLQQQQQNENGIRYADAAAAAANRIAAEGGSSSFWDSLWGKEREVIVQQKKPAVVDESKPIPPAWLRWLLQIHNNNDNDNNNNMEAVGGDVGSNKKGSSIPTAAASSSPFIRVLLVSWIDPRILNFNSENTITSLIDKVLTSTVRLLLIANWLVALTLMLHAAVAELFLGPTSALPGAGNGSNTNAHATDPTRDPWTAAPGPAIGGGGSSNQPSRDRVSGFLVFKLLLLSAVVTPDTLDLLILLSWFTALAFLRSLVALSAQQNDAAQAAGQMPAPGVLRLLLAVLCCDCMAATVCATLFHKAGIGMVLLLTCDCALLAIDSVQLILLNLQLVWEVQNTDRLRAIEDQQLEAHQHRDLQASARLDREMEVLEQQNLRKLSILDSTAFGLLILSDLLTVAHFIHIWTLHGLQFTLIDGVLVLHLHSGISSLSKNISERRNIHRIARDMECTFENASELDLRKAAASGDVCCICLGTMSFFHNQNVKKVSCGHLYHTACLREVVERARSMEAARCPLCRDYMVNGNSRERSGADRPIDTGTEEMVGRNVNHEDAGIPPRATTEQALFQFSTEGVFPTWMPVPAFSFAVVRRQAAALAPPPDAPEEAPRGDENAPENDNAIAENPLQAQSFLRRLLILAGAIAMSPEEERASITQLVDMFPQYDRQDLLRALRSRGSSEAVTESILLGTFVGTPRGGVR